MTLQRKSLTDEIVCGETISLRGETVREHWHDYIYTRAAIMTATGVDL